MSPELCRDESLWMVVFRRHVLLLTLKGEVRVVWMLVVGWGKTGVAERGWMRRRRLRVAGAFEHVSRDRLKWVDGCC
jgi:hypothetical protein